MNTDAKFDEKVLALIAEAIPGRFKKVRITPETLLRNELGIDSLGIAALVFRLEDAFGIELGDQALEANVSQLRTVGDALQASRQIVSRAKAQQAS